MQKIINDSNSYSLRDAINMRFVIRIFLIFMLVHSCIGSSFAAQEDTPRNVLILASYHPGMTWEDSIISEIKLHFAMKMPSAIISVEYMDTKRIAADEARLSDLKALYQKKYANPHTNRPFDIIISVDTDAFNFLLKNRDDLFPGTPVVFCGVVHFDDKMLSGKEGFTGVVEAYDVQSTISLMLKLHPKTRHIAIITDQTATGKAARKVLDAVIPRFEGNVSFKYLENLTVEELRQSLQALSNDSLVLLMTMNRDRTGVFLAYEDAAQLVQEASPVPFYSIYDFYLGYGVVGGKMISSYFQGDEAADMALCILQGESAGSIPVMKECINRYMFDYFILTRFGIPLDRLPPGSIIINQPFQARASLANENLSRLSLCKKDLRQSDLHGSNLAGTNLCYSNLMRSNLSDARLQASNLSYTDLEEANLHSANLSLADVKGANLVGADMIESNLSGADLSGADLDQARITESILSGANFSGARLEAANLSLSDMSGTKFVGAFMNRVRLRDSIMNGSNLSQTSLVGANIIKADLSGSCLDRADISESRMAGANLFAARLTNIRSIHANLTGTNLSRADLSESSFLASGLSGSDISNANLSGCYLEDTWIERSNLIGSKLIGAKLTGSQLNDSDLSGCDLSEADLTDAHLNAANLNSANLSRARLIGTDFTLAIIEKASLVNSSFLGARLNWIDMSDSLLQNCQFGRAELFAADLSRSDLSGSDFTRAYLTRANLSGCKMSNCKLSYADMSYANLSGADMRGISFRCNQMDYADFSGADLRGATFNAISAEGMTFHKASLNSVKMSGVLLKGQDLSYADLRNIEISRSSLEDINLTGADLGKANLTIVHLANVDLSGANLEGVKYDQIGLIFLASCRLNGTRMSPDLKDDIDRILSG